MKKEDPQAIEVGYGIAKDPSSVFAGMEAAKQALSNIHLHNISAVLVFTSVVYNLDEVLQGIYSVVGEVPVLGATTAGEICNGMHTGTVTVVVLASPFLRVHCGMGSDVSGDWRQALDEAIHSPDVQPFFHNGDYRREMRRKGREIFVMLFSPGNTCQSDDHCFEIVEELKAKTLGDLPIVGGSAADDWRMERNYILYGQQAYPDSLLLAVFETELQFGISLAHGFRPTGINATVTAVEGQEILTLDEAIAADVYSKLVSLPREELEGRRLTYATGATSGISDPMGQYSVNIASYFTERGGIRLTQPVALGTVLTRMETDPDSMILWSTEGIRRAIIRGGITDVAIGIVSYCALRCRIMGNRSAEEIAGMAKVLGGKPLVGFCSFGEQGVAIDGVSRHNSSAVACLVLGSQLSQTARIAFENNKLLKEVEFQQAMLIKSNGELLKEISERKKIEEALRESETKLKDFAQAVPDVSMIVDEDGRIIEAFGNNDKLLSRRIEEVKGLNLYQILPAEDAEVCLNQVRQTILCGTPQYVVREVEIRGIKRFIERRAAPMRYLANGKRTVAIVAIDVTEQCETARMLQLAYELRRRSDFFNDIISGHTILDKRTIEIAKSWGIDFTHPLFCCLLAVETGLTAKSGKDSTDTQMLKNDIIDLLSKDTGYLVWDCRGGIGILCQVRSTDDSWGGSMRVASQFKESIRRYDSNLIVLIGVSDIHTGLGSIKSSFRQAWNAVISARCQEVNVGGVYHFRDLGIYQLLAGLGGKEHAMEFVQEKIGKLILYDREKGANFLLTLEAILQSTNLKEAAEKMFLHHKTLVFRKQRIEKILGVSVDHFETRLALATAIKLHKLSCIIN